MAFILISIKSNYQVIETYSVNYLTGDIIYLYLNESQYHLYQIGCIAIDNLPMISFTYCMLSLLILIIFLEIKLFINYYDESYSL